LIGNIQDRLGTSKRRHPTSSRKLEVENVKRPKVMGERRPRSPSSANSSSASKPESPEADPSRTGLIERSNVVKEQYERRPRHKTKAHKYDLKNGLKPPDSGQADTGKKRSSKRRRRKSGLILNNDFKAPNVAQDRLTLKANGGPGMFHNGKASTQVNRRGVPDLVFSEMSFLSKPKSHHKALQRDSKDRRSKSERKDKERTERIAEYFDHSAAAKSCIRLTTESMPSEQSTAHVPGSPNRSRSDSQHPKERRRPQPNHGLRRHSTPRKDCDLPISQKKRISDVRQPQVEHYRPHTSPTYNRQQAGSPTSHYSWSITPSRRGQSLKEAARISIHKPLKAARSDGYHLDEGRPHADDKYFELMCQEQIAREQTHESSVSQLSLDQYTKSMLLGSQRDFWNRHQAQRPNTELYTLADLKHLSRLEKLGVSPKEHYAQQDEHGRQTPASRDRLLSSRMGQVNGHEPNRRSDRGESFKKPRITSNNAHHLWMPEIQLPGDVMETCNHSARQVTNAVKSLDSAARQHGNLNQSKLADESARAGSKGTLGRRKHPRDPPSERDSRTLSGRASFGTTLQPDPRSNRRNDFSEQPTRGRPAISNAQQIIHEIEQEELLISQGNNYTFGSINDDAGVAMENHSEQLKRPGFSAAGSSMHDYDILLAQEHGTPFEQRVDQTRYQNEVDDVPAQDLHRPYSPVDSRTRGHTLNQSGPDAMRLDTDLPSEHHRLMIHGAFHLAEQQRKQDMESSLADFWRPRILY
jgi:hypothetical protein